MVNTVKAAIVSTVGIIGGMVCTALGGWDTWLQGIVGVMAVDYITGLMVAGVFKTSQKTQTGTLSSKIGFQGICKKIAIILCIYISVKIDLIAGTNICRNSTVIAFIANEILSIGENLGLMGLKLPTSITGAIDNLVKKDGDKQ
jgi:toxin secretion/phage lysis holin